MKVSIWRAYPIKDVTMKVAIVSDIHGNIEALDAVLADIDRMGIGRIVCLGDAIGYGPDPDIVVERLRERAVSCIVGNHELGVLGRLDLHWFNRAVRESLWMTRSLLTQDDMRFIEGLPETLSLGRGLFVHGVPPRSAITYLFSVSDMGLRRIFSRMEERVCFVGHTHLLGMVRFDGENITRGLPHEGCTKLDLGWDGKCIVNAGSVGQPRDGNNAAKYVIWDVEGESVETRFVPYDFETTVGKLLDRGLPVEFARRLR